MTAPAEDPRGGERPCCGHPNALTDPLHAIPAAGRGDTDSSGEHVGSCRIFYAERRCTCVGPAARPAGDRAQPTEGLREAVRLLDLLAEDTDDVPCRYDHHGACQEHGGGSEEPGACSDRDAHELLKRLGIRRALDGA